MSLVGALTPVVEAFEALSIDYQVGGSVASSLHGVPRSTMDVDVAVDMRDAQVAPFLLRIAGAYYAPIELLQEAVARRSSTNLLHVASGYKVDLFVCKDTEYDRLSIKRALERPLDDGGRNFRVATAEDILIRKFLWYRAGDETSERQWHDILGVLRARHRQLDRTYLQHWAEDQRVGDLLVRACRETSP